jgi:hypothetical protein
LLSLGHSEPISQLGVGSSGIGTHVEIDVAQSLYIGEMGKSEITQRIVASGFKTFRTWSHKCGEEL